ncbi:hypothetical protein COI89_10850 [Bacillus cereus]|nr:hypothetical protein COI89_10850 [Bacillus cereus]
MNTLKGFIFDPHFKTKIFNRTTSTRRGTIIDNMFLFGDRKPLKHSGLILCNHIVTRDNTDEAINYPRQEPLEHSWKKLNT